MIVCPHCSGENSSNAKFCRHCGSPISEEIHSSTRLPLGTILDERYKIIDYVAKGGMGAVYKAVDLTQQSTFWAVKEMLDYFDTTDEREYAVERFATEAQILYDLNHDCIPKFVDCFVSENRYYLVMEFIDGKDLRKILEDAQANNIQGLSERNVITWSTQICDVLDYLHTQNPPIIYRDLKPGNLMINKENKVYLIDFGIARLFDPRIKGTMVGTQGYAPPEQYRGEAEPRSDMYSLAACMHHLLTGKDPRNDIPFNFPSAKSIRSELSQEIDTVLTKALSMDPKDRYQDMKELKELLIKSLPINSREIENSPLKELARTTEYSKPVSTSIIIPQDEDIPYIGPSQLSFWYTFRSDRRHSGKSPFGSNIQGKSLWTFNAKSEIRSSPTIGIDGTIYFGANNGKLYALSPEGQLKWSFNTRSRIISSVALNRKGNIFFGSNDGYLYCLDPDGNFLWKFKTYGRLRSSPCIDIDDTIYIGSYDHYLYAINPKGELKWRVNLAGYLEATPAISDKGYIYIASKGAFNTKSYFYCLRNSGEIKWYTEIDSPIKSSPCISKDENIYFGGTDGKLYSFNNKGNLLWNFQSEGPIISSPIVNDGKSILFCSFDCNVYCLDTSGEFLWNFKTFSSIGSSPSMAGNNSIFIGSDDYYIYNISSQGQLFWRTKCQGRLRSSPAIGENDILYIGSDDGNLYAIE